MSIFGTFFAASKKFLSMSLFSTNSAESIFKFESLFLNWLVFGFAIFSSSIILNLPSFNFLEKSGELGNVNTLENTSEFKFDDQNSLLFKTRRNRKISLTEYYDFIYEYKNDCLTASIQYNNEYYSDNDLKATEELFFSISIIPLFV